MIGANIRFGKGSMNSCRANFDGHGRVQSSDSHLKWLKTNVFVGENAKLPLTDTDGDTTGKLVLIGTEPGVTLGLFEDVMEDGIVSVVVHSGGHRGRLGRAGSGGEPSSRPLRGGES